MKSDNWEYYILDGSEFSSIKGNLVTIKDKANCPNYWFSGETTVVLGRTGNPELIDNIETVCSWEIINKHRDIQYIESCYLFIGCIRHFGGLHSAVYNSRVDIYLNKNQVDGFALRVIPESHSDYFHRIPESVIQKPKVIKDCKTIYSWTIHEDFLSENNKQTIELRLDKYVYWDIDYIGLAFKLKKKVPKIFLSHSWVDKPVARNLSIKLAKRGIYCWLDEAEINIGDSLIEKIREAIDNVEYVGALISKASIKSEWVRKELDVAMNQEINGKRVKVLPILLDDSELPGFLLGKLYADLRSPDKINDVVNMIKTRMK